jgi:hypothetical protein
MKAYSQLYTVKTGYGTDPVPCPVGTGTLSLKRVKLTTRFHIVLRLAMCRAIPLLPHMTSWHMNNFIFYLTKVQ